MPKKEYIHPSIEGLYGMVGAAYQLALRPDEPVIGPDKFYEEQVKHHIISNDISSLMASFTAKLNQINKKIWRMDKEAQAYRELKNAL